VRRTLQSEEVWATFALVTIHKTTEFSSSSLLSINSDSDSDSEVSIITAEAVHSLLSVHWQVTFVITAPTKPSFVCDVASSTMSTKLNPARNIVVLWDLLEF